MIRLNPKGIQALLFYTAFRFACSVATAAGAEPAPVTGDLFVHDPSTILKEGPRYYLFSTGPGISAKSSTNLSHWTREKSVFAAPPGWTTNSVPGFRGYFWAPDVIRLGTNYYLYYSVSTFGKQVSAIGLATSPTLDSSSPQYQWIDQGLVIQSREGDPFNAIDPNLYLDKDRKLWMTFGSFWRGIYTVELDPQTGKRLVPQSPFHHLAYSESIEAATLHRRGDDYYLFVNWGTCCRGTNSTYEIRVGRSKQVTGPYLDKDGRDLRRKGGTFFLGTEGTEIGPGHISIFKEGEREVFSYHVYDANLRGRSQLRTRTLRWTEDGWPVAGN
jgi:arabinan endo-1,5-alpha-L-arabinosidase